MTARQFSIKRIFSLLLLCFVLASGSDPVMAEDAALQQFWSQLRQAVLNEDKSAVADLAKFPLGVGGPTDDSPIVKINRKRFVESVYDQLFTEVRSVTVGKTVVQKSVRQNVIDTVALEPLPGNDWGYAGLFPMEFRKIGKHWRLVRIFLDKPLR